MSLEKNLRKIERIILENADQCKCDGPVPKREILRAEKDLEIKFPISYLWFLLTFGHGFWADHEIFGMASIYDPEQQTGIPYVVSTTQILRERFQIPSQFFAVSGDDEGYYYLVNAGSEERREDADLYLLDVNTSQVEPLFDDREHAVQLSDFYIAILDQEEI